MGKLLEYLYSNQIARLIIRLCYLPLPLGILEKKFFQIIDKNADNKKIMINIGGGHFFRRHWKILDFSSRWYSYLPGAVDFNFDLSSDKPLPFKNNHVSFFYSSHTIEHIAQEHTEFLFNEFYRCLKPGGAIRITLPDYDLVVKAYLNNDEDFFETYKEEKTLEAKFFRCFATDLADKVNVEEISKNFKQMSKEEFADFYTNQISRESHTLTPGNHISWWNFDKLSESLKKAGFRKICKSKEQESNFSEMRGRGSLSGFDTTVPDMSLIIEAIK